MKGRKRTDAGSKSIPSRLANPCVRRKNAPRDLSNKEKPPMHVVSGNAGKSASEPPSGETRRLTILRHGERSDLTFNYHNQNWLSLCLNSSGHYDRVNLNMPACLTDRKDGLLAYATDSPLTVIGTLQCKLVGRAIVDEHVKPPTAIYSSPALRCVESAACFLKGMGKPGANVNINVEPGLFEWCAWFEPSLPRWIDYEDSVNSFGFPVNKNYRPVYSSSELSTRESLQEYYIRSHKVIQKILEMDRSSHVWIIAHGASLDACTRQLIGFPIRNRLEFTRVLELIPYVAMLTIEQQKGESKWRVVPPPVPPLTHQTNQSTNWEHYVGDNFRKPLKKQALV